MARVPDLLGFLRGILMPDRGSSQELQLKRFGYEVSIITPDYFVPFPDGTSLTLWGDLDSDAANIAKLIAARRRGLRRRSTGTSSASRRC